ncbi:MAG TPA: glutathionylspermidine synthase family protein [Fimbriimonadaceae bacterium]|nr:glutathionylspermidine synthase family protein [Fimbriimonadaceae bacterium]
MERIPIPERPDWRKKVEELGLLFHTTEDKPYWFEQAYYRFNERQIDQLETATNELHKLCLEAVQLVIDHDRFRDLAIPATAIPAIKWSWQNQVPSIYGRFDLAYDGFHAPKLLEYNADTPTALLEAAVIQWHWLQELFPKADQFNSIWEGLVATWQQLKASGRIKNNLAHFGYVDSIEDFMTITVLQDTAQEAGLQTQEILMADIGWDSTYRCFADLKEREMQTIFKLYPWEWLIAENFADEALSIYSQVNWIEPIWKMILSNKGILAILWEMHPGHELLAEAHIGEPHGLFNWIKKPLLGREGANVTLKVWGQTTETGGEYGEEGYVYQDYVELPNKDGSHPVMGCWVIDGKAHGMGIRESDGPITDNFSRFVPHLFE